MTSGNNSSILHLFSTTKQNKSVSKINENLLKISAGYIVLDKPLELGHDVSVIVQGSVTQITDKDLQNGEKDRIYTVKGVLSTVISQENGEILGEVTE